MLQQELDAIGVSAALQIVNVYQHQPRSCAPVGMVAVAVARTLVTVVLAGGAPVIVAGSKPSEWTSQTYTGELELERPWVGGVTDGLSALVKDGVMLQNPREGAGIDVVRWRRGPCAVEIGAFIVVLWRVNQARIRRIRKNQTVSITE